MRHDLCSKHTHSQFTALPLFFEHGQLGQGHKDNIGDDYLEMGDHLNVTDWGTGFVVEDIACGLQHTCSLSTNGSVRCCGRGVILSLYALSSCSLMAL